MFLQRLYGSNLRLISSLPCIIASKIVATAALILCISFYVLTWISRKISYYSRLWLLNCIIKETMDNIFMSIDYWRVVSYIPKRLGLIWCYATRLEKLLLSTSSRLRLHVKLLPRWWDDGCLHVRVCTSSCCRRWDDGCLHVCVGAWSLLLWARGFRHLLIHM
jgi:hypothetical protein